MAPLSQEPAGILAALPSCWDESEELRSVLGAGTGSVSLLSHGQSSVGSLGLCFVSSLLLFAHLKGHSPLSNPSGDVPPAHLAKDGFACSWSSVFNMRVSPWCITLIHILSAPQHGSDTRTDPTSSKYCYCDVLFIPWKNIEETKWEKISSFFLKSASR